MPTMSLLSWKTSYRLSNVNVSVCCSWYIDNRMKDGKTKTLTDLKVKVSECARHHDLSLEQKTKAMKAREKNVVARTFHGAGIVVPVDKTGVGYRPLPETTGRRLKAESLTLRSNARNTSCSILSVFGIKMFLTKINKMEIFPYYT